MTTNDPARRWLRRTVLALGLAAAFPALPPAFAASVAPVAAENGMVVTAQRLATRVGSTCSGAAATRSMRRSRSATRSRWSTRPPAISAAAGS